MNSNGSSANAAIQAIENVSFTPLLLSKMSKVGFTCFMVFVTAVILPSERVEGKRKYFFARRIQDLMHLANIDFEIAEQLRSFKGDLERGNKSWPLFTAAVT